MLFTCQISFYNSHFKNKSVFVLSLYLIDSRPSFGYYATHLIVSLANSGKWSVCGSQISPHSLRRCLHWKTFLEPIISCFSPLFTQISDKSWAFGSTFDDLAEPNVRSPSAFTKLVLKPDYKSMQWGFKVCASNQCTTQCTTEVSAPCRKLVPATSLAFSFGQSLALLPTRSPTATNLRIPNRGRLGFRCLLSPLQCFALFTKILFDQIDNCPITCKCLDQDHLLNHHFLNVQRSISLIGRRFYFQFTRRVVVHPVIAFYGLHIHRAYLLSHLS